MLRKLLIGLLVALFASVAIIFAWLNPGMVKLDLAFASFDIPMATAITASLVIGWLFGLACVGAYLLSIMRERRRFKKALKLAEAEVANLRGLLMRDAS